MRTLTDINQAFPDHARSSCSDDDLTNAGISESGNLWCPRCQTLHELALQAEIKRLKQLLKESTL